MIVVIQNEGESRKDYLIRVAIAMLWDNAFSMNRIIYDEATCDAMALAEDLQIELDMSLKQKTASEDNNK